MTPTITDLPQLQSFLAAHRTEIEQWFERQWQDHPIPFYSSVDVRESQFKIASVDANLFPGGFNNIHSDCHQWSSKCLLQAAKAFCHQVDGILLMAEKIDRNPFYTEHIIRLQKLLIDAGIPTRLIRDDVAENQTLTLNGASGEEAVFHAVTRRENRLWSGKWSPCAILLNDDLSKSSAEKIALFENIEQTILPEPALGWFRRRKSEHFRHYSEVVKEFCIKFSIDSWLIDPLFRVCEDVDVESRTGLDCVASHCELMLATIGLQYRERGIDAPPTCFVKSDQGTHGFGVIQIDDPQQVFKLNRKQRKAMSFGKSGEPIRRVIIQECIPSRLIDVDQSIREQVFYTVHSQVIGGFFRSHTNKSAYQSLNSPGMTFQPICRNDIEQRYYWCQVIARFSLLAAAREEIDTSAPTGSSRTSTSELAAGRIAYGK